MHILHKGCRPSRRQRRRCLCSSTPEAVSPSRLPLVVSYRRAVVQELLREAAPEIEVREDVLPKSAASRLENEKRKKSENKLRKRGRTDDFRNRAASEIKQKEKNAAMGLEENKRTAPFR
ncbi:hypothetical protein ACP275_08G103800 [Erythranthe tilingii]